jgi:hypothetical protein
MNVNYDPADEWDKFVDNQEKADRDYIEENSASQEKDLCEFMDKLIKEWNAFYPHQNPKMSHNESILLCIYICGYFTNQKHISSEKADRIFAILEDFPEVDALECGFTDDLQTAVKALSNLLEE